MYNHANGIASYRCSIFKNTGGRMKSNELRIGNWIDCGTYVNKGHWSKFERIKITSGSQLNVTDNLKPISITPEILEKAGFKKLQLMYEKVLEKGMNGNDKLAIDLEGICLLIGYSYDEAVTVQSKIKYLHQLQNLYFALTGEELAIEL
jgi:hypothetical protein